MAFIKGTGVPTRQTSGAIGDIYVDTNTGEQYKCVFAYRSDNDTNFDCQWSPTKKVIEEPKVEEKKPSTVKNKTVTKVTEEKVEKPVEENVKENKPGKSTARTNYTSYGKKSK